MDPVALEAELRARMTALGVPAQDHDGLVLYVLHGVAPGHFLAATLAGDFFEMAARADDANQRAFMALARFLYNHVPAGCFGSHDKVQAWYDRGGLKGRAESP